MSAAAVTGLLAEARIVRRAGLAVAAVGGDAARAAREAERLLAEGAAGLVSFGIAGGLDPALASGMLLLPRAVRGDGEERWEVESQWRRRLATTLATAGLAVSEGDLLGAGAVAASAEDKRALFQRTGAAALDLESHAVARVAARAERPFVALRALADPAGRDLPPAALVGLDAQGRPAVGPVLAALAKDPRQVAALFRLARDTQRALAALRRAVAVLDAGSRPLMEL
jgi:hopanoid-associated phosphorylase